MTLKNKRYPIAFRNCVYPDQDVHKLSLISICSAHVHKILIFRILCSEHHRPRSDCGNAAQSDLGL